MTPSAVRRAAGRAAPEAAAAAVSLALSGLVLAGGPPLNNDGVYYLHAADVYARDGLAAARAVHPWPFHSILIAASAAAAGVSTETAARGLGAVLLGGVGAAFVGVVRALGADRRVLWLAVAVVSCHPFLNHSRALVVRDFGAWVFGLLALRSLLRSGAGRRVGMLAAWAACGMAAALFRPDAGALLAAAPVAIALRGDMEPRRRRRAALATLAPGLLVLAAAASWWLAGGPRAERIVSTVPFRTAAAALADSFPMPYGREYAPLLLGAGLFALPFVKAIKTAGLAHVALAAAGAARGGPIAGFPRAALLVTLAAAVIPLHAQAARLLFVESRHAVPATLVFCAWAPFGLHRLLRAPARRAVAVAAGAALAAALLSGLTLRHPSEDHVAAAAAWIRANTGGAPLHTNSLQLAYRSGSPVYWAFVHGAHVNGALDGIGVRRGDVWAVRVAPQDAALRSALRGVRTFRYAAAFVGEGGDTVYVFRCAADQCVSGD